MRSGRGREIDVLKQRVHPLAARLGLQAEEAGAERQELRAREVVIEVRVLRQIPHLSKTTDRHVDRPRRRAHEPERDLDGSGLPSAVRPQQAEDLARCHGEVDALEDLYGAAAKTDVDGLAKVADRECGGSRQARARVI